jgi:hypothetical protein
MDKEYTKIDRHGSKFYYKDPEMTILHRKDGPAIEHYEGGKMWYVNNKSHRLDGPAIERAWGINEWWVNDVFMFTVSVNIASKTDMKIIHRMR